jgi:uncharacterized RDD family membrane protein YckC
METTQYAGFWKRFAAYCIDKLLISAVTLMLVLPVLAFFGVGILTVAMEEREEELVAVILAAIVSYGLLALALTVMTWLYHAVMESSTQQATLGKMALGIKVTDLEGRRISFGRATGRYFSKIISDLTFSIGYILAGFTDKKQALHDMVASCLVVNKDRK